MKCIRPMLLVVLAAVAPASACRSAIATPELHWTDVESQIQYGFYTEDARSLGRLAEVLSQAAGEDPRGAYFAALANYRRAQTNAEHDRAVAAAAVGQCVTQIEVPPGWHDDAESLALDAACRRLARSLGALQLLAANGIAELARAVRLAPRNPRVVLIDALAAYDRGASGARERALQRLQQAAQLFEAERREATVTPGWGAAEAYAFLGRAYLDQGDAAAARGALERALLIAPDFLFARRLMVRILG